MLRLAKEKLSFQGDLRPGKGLQGLLGRVSGSGSRRLKKNTQSGHLGGWQVSGRAAPGA